jgi:predicted metal-dependent phosphoesterase TrpH
VSAAALAAAVQVPSRERTGRAPDAARVFADFHIHTRFSRDSLLAEERFVRIALERGLTHVAITNHNNIEGALAVREKVREMGLDERLTVILGEEVSTSDGEVVGLFLQRTISRGLTADQTADAIHAQGGLVSIPHPFDPFRNAHIREAPLERLAEAGKIDAVEVFNCRVTLSRHNLKAAEFAARYGIPGIAASDTHSAYEIAMASNVLPPFSSAGELKALLPANQWHASRSTVLIHVTTRWAVWKNVFDTWRGKPAAGGLILGPEPAEQVARGPVERPSAAELPKPEAESESDPDDGRHD